MQTARRCVCGAALLSAPPHRSAAAIAGVARPSVLSELAHPSRRRRLHSRSASSALSERVRDGADRSRRHISDFAAREDPWAPSDAPFGRPFPASADDGRPTSKASPSGSKAKAQATAPSAGKKLKRSERKEQPPHIPKEGEEKGWAPVAGEVWTEADGGSASPPKKQRLADDEAWLIGVSTQLERVPGPFEDVPAPMLTHGLERVLFNPGVHFLRDPRSGVYNFDHRLEDLPWPEDVHLDRLAQFVKPSDDPELVRRQPLDSL